MNIARLYVATPVFVKRDLFTLCEISPTANYLDLYFWLVFLVYFLYNYFNEDYFPVLDHTHTHTPTLLHCGRHMDETESL